jgi:capsular polysaccharide transport system permease protein
MTTKPRVKKFRIRRDAPLMDPLPQLAPGPVSAGDTDLPIAGTDSPADTPRRAGAGLLRAALSETEVDSPATVVANTDMDAIRQEGLTGRQLRMARRVAQKHGLAVTSDFDAVQQLRRAGIDPFQRSNILELVVPTNPNEELGAGPGELVPQGRIQLPQTVPQGPRNLPSTERASPADRRANEIMKIQQDIARRRRRKLALLMARLAVFVFLPTIFVGWYFYAMATPMFGTKSEFTITKAEASGAAGLGGLFQGTSMATQQDSTTVQSYLTSRAAMNRLDAEHGFRAHFTAADIDPIQRLDPEASSEDMYKVYQNHVVISYDPTEGILKMEVIAADPATSQEFSEALINYAEEQVDQLTLRPREDSMAGARANYEAAEQRRADALAAWLKIQEDVQQIDPIGETSARTAQISTLETQRQQLQLELQTRLNVRRPNEAQVASLRSQIAGIESLIGDLRTDMTADTVTGGSLAAKNTELRTAEENYTFQTLQVQSALTQMEAAQIEANRQVRYLSVGVVPVAPDEPTYPRAFENTLLAFLIFAGIYLMISLTASILREQVTS